MPIAGPGPREVAEVREEQRSGTPPGYLLEQLGEDGVGGRVGPRAAVAGDHKGERPAHGRRRDALRHQQVPAALRHSGPAPATGQSGQCVRWHRRHSARGRVGCRSRAADDLGGVGELHDLRLRQRVQELLDGRVPRLQQLGHHGFACRCEEQGDSASGRLPPLDPALALEALDQPQGSRLGEPQRMSQRLDRASRYAPIVTRAGGADAPWPRLCSAAWRTRRPRPAREGANHVDGFVGAMH